MKVFKFSPHQIISIFFLLICMLGFFYWFSPGVMTWDSSEQLRQARSSDFNDWQPPLMAWVWRQLLTIDDGPGVMLFFHLLMLYGGCWFLYLWAVKRHFLSGLFFLFIPLCPWIFNFEFVIWKDVGLAFSWLLAISLAIYFSDREKFPVVIAIVIALLFAYGAFIRLNSLSAVIVIAPFLAACIFKRKTAKLFLLTGLFSVPVLMMLPILVNNILSAQERHPASYVMFDDLAALKIKGVEVSFLNAEDKSTLESCGRIIETKVGAAFCLNDKFEDMRQNHYDDLKLEWKILIKKNFFSYLAYRVDTFGYLIRSPQKNPYYYFQFQSPSQAQSLVATLSVNYILFARELIPEVFKPYFWIVVAALLAFSLKALECDTCLPFWMLPASGITYVLSYLPTTPADDFRYVYWLCLVDSVSLIILAAMIFGKNKYKK